jgi:hypothetical protein
MRLPIIRVAQNMEIRRFLLPIIGHWLQEKSQVGGNCGFNNLMSLKSKPDSGLACISSKP